jgi:hypothetical protein
MFSGGLEVFGAEGSNVARSLVATGESDNWSTISPFLHTETADRHHPQRSRYFCPNHPIAGKNPALRSHHHDDPWRPMNKGSVAGRIQLSKLTEPRPLLRVKTAGAGRVGPGTRFATTETLALVDGPDRPAADCWREQWQPLVQQESMRPPGPDWARNLFPRFLAESRIHEPLLSEGEERPTELSTVGPPSDTRFGRSEVTA